MEEKLKSTVKNISTEKDVNEKLEKAIKKINLEADELADRAAKEEKISVMSESTSMRKEIPSIVSKIEKLVDQLSKM